MQILMVSKCCAQIIVVVAAASFCCSDICTVLAQPLNSNHTGVTTEGACKEAEGPYDVHRWFADYDAIRRGARMGLMDKFQSRHLLLFAFDPMAVFGREAEPLLDRMINKYTEAVEKMEQLTQLPETQELCEGYLRYFRHARLLFVDIRDAENGDRAMRDQIVPDLMERKRNLEVLDQKNKQLDGVLRKRYDIPPLKG